MQPLDETPEMVASIASLRSHAGFNWLVRKLKLQAARLRHELDSRKQEKLEDYYFLQSGINWCNWLQQQVDFANEKVSARRATPQETAQFKDIESVLELIGQQ